MQQKKKENVETRDLILNCTYFSAIKLNIYFYLLSCDATQFLFPNASVYRVLDY